MALQRPVTAAQALPDKAEGGLNFLGAARQRQDRASLRQGEAEGAVLALARQEREVGDVQAGRQREQQGADLVD
jgi:hypothetical protein